MDKIRKYNKYIILLLTVANIIFLAYWLILAYYSHLHYDDLHFLWRSREMSIIEFVKYFYFTRSGRFVIYGMNAVVSRIVDMFGSHWLLALCYYSCGVGACWLAIKDLKINISQIGLFMGTCFVYNMYVLTNIDFPVFFWPCAMMYYLSLPFALLLFKYIVVEKLNWKQWILLVFLVIFIGGSYETFVPIILLAFLCYGIYCWHSKEWIIKQTWSMPQIKKMVWVGIILIVMLVIVVVAPGNFNRMQESMNVSGEGFCHPDGIIGWFTAVFNSIGMFFYFILFYIPYYIIILLLGAFVGGKTDKKFCIKKSKTIILIVVVFWFFLVLTALPMAYLYNGFGIQRAYTAAVLALLLTIFGIGYVIGYGKSSLCFARYSIICLLFLIVIMCINIYNDTPSARKYSIAVEERIDNLMGLQSKGQTGTIVIEPLPLPYTEDLKHFVRSYLGKENNKAVLYYVSDAAVNPNEYEGHMKKVLRLDFDFVIPDKQEHAMFDIDK